MVQIVSRSVLSLVCDIIGLYTICSGYPSLHGLQAPPSTKLFNAGGVVKESPPSNSKIVSAGAILRNLRILTNKKLTFISILVVSFLI